MKNHSVRQRIHPIIRLILMVACVQLLIFLYCPAPQPVPIRLIPEASAPTVSVYNEDEQTMLSLPLEDYVARVTALEMPISFHKEALRTQAVAARSYVCRRLHAFGGSGCVRHPEADVCSSFSCCQAFLPMTLMPDDLFIRAAQDTAGEVVTYDGTIINALYHASSGGRTENSEAVFSAALPYLRAVDSPGEESYPQFVSEQFFSINELSCLLPIDKEAPLDKQMLLLESDASGRVILVRVGNTLYKGTELRQLLGLSSTRMRFTFSEDGVSILTIGSGHGVGLSQTGADAMACKGASYREILCWYYTGCRIETLY